MNFGRKNENSKIHNNNLKNSLYSFFTFVFLRLSLYFCTYFTIAEKKTKKIKQQKFHCFISIFVKIDLFQLVFYKYFFNFSL